jgi:molybdopterin-guanine dinucleotide biosynthesis protein A
MAEAQPLEERVRRVAGAVLAGGRSRRFGAVKALAPLQGRPLVLWSLDALRAAAFALCLNGPADLAEAAGCAAAPDDPDLPEGPLRGLCAAMTWAAQRGASHLLTAPCDTPFLPPDFAQRLMGAIGSRRVAAAKAERAHPLCALWSLDAGADLRRAAADADQPSLQALIQSQGGAFAAFDSEADFANVNTQDDLRAAELRLKSA